MNMQERALPEWVRVLCVPAPVFALIPSLYVGGHATAIISLLLWRTNCMFFGSKETRLPSLLGMRMKRLTISRNERPE
ncbi:hypothetical protein Q31b_31560 [Novipirellula aureliae]|uniref:Type IV secretory pathway, VirB3-like protein n=1 Tax=Novipirellula aureliae TaxID=2527966 RepID=A0A5C6DWT4_9BACT|nr:hypothetical protein [Novipirellula aureliae]TWU39841.1 hypothetical protein Q31b_31560 [Novipirellula aureliae]